MKKKLMKGHILHRNRFQGNVLDTRAGEDKEDEGVQIDISEFGQLRMVVT